MVNALQALEHTLDVTLSYMHSIQAQIQRICIVTRMHKPAIRSTMPATTCTNDQSSIGRVRWHVHEAINHGASPHTHAMTATCNVSATCSCLAADGNSMMILMGQHDPHAASGKPFDVDSSQIPATANLKSGAGEPTA